MEKKPFTIWVGEDGYLHWITKEGVEGVVFPSAVIANDSQDKEKLDMEKVFA